MNLVKNNKGFALIEVLIVSVTIATALIVLYVQFRTVDNNFDNSINYNNVNSLYKTATLKKFIGSEIDLYNILLDSSVDGFVNLISCDINSSFKEFCLNLFTKTGVKEIIYTNKNLDKLNTNISSKNIGNSMKGFIKYIEYKSDTTDNYSRIIVRYNNNTFATLLLGGKI